jgi:hypothetical protein
VIDELVFSSVRSSSLSLVTSVYCLAVLVSGHSSSPLSVVIPSKTLMHSTVSARGTEEKRRKKRRYKEVIRKVSNTDKRSSG